MFERIRDQLVGDQAERDGLLGAQMHIIDLDFDGYRPHVSEGVSKMGAELFQIRTHLDPTLVLEWLEVLMRAGDRLNACHRLLERALRLRVILRPCLKGEDGCHKGKIVLCPMTELAQ